MGHHRAQEAEAEKDKLQEQLNQAQKMESVGRLAGGVAHDFNNMLQVILGHAEMALEADGPDQSAARRTCRRSGRRRERSADLTRQLLAFARKQTVAPRILDLNDTVSGMLKMLRRLIGEDIDLIWPPGPEPGLVRMDPSQVDQILANLCINARDAIAGTGKITIETALSGRIWASQSTKLPLPMCRCPGTGAPPAISVTSPSSRTAPWACQSQMLQGPTVPVFCSMESAATNGSAARRLCYAEAIAGWHGQELLNIVGDDIRATGLRTTLWRFLRFGIVPLLPIGPSKHCGTGFAKFARDHRRWQSRTGSQSQCVPGSKRGQRFGGSRSDTRLGGWRNAGNFDCYNDAYQRLAIEMSERLYAQIGLEMRQPFWNARIIEFALATPERSRLRGQEDKWLHRRAMTRAAAGKCSATA